MEKSVIEELIEAKHEYDDVIASFFNDGSVKKDEKYMYKYLERAKTSNEFYLITATMKDATKAYSLRYDFDAIKINLLLGIIYDTKDIDANNQIKENANPYNGIVRFYTSDVASFLDDEKTNEHNYDYGRQGFIRFDKLMSEINKSGLVYNGPKSFEELKDKINNKEEFEISLTASLKEDINSKEEVKVEQPVEEKPKRKSLFRR